MTDTPTPVQPVEGFEYLLDDLLRHLDEAGLTYDRERVSAAFAFAHAQHGTQKRKSGEPFIVHPVEVAKLVTDLLLDEDSVIASLLHDVVEDTAVESPAIEERFGTSVAQLVDGVTKLTRINFQSREQAQVENYRKMIVAMASDLRVILIKLADRLHNMRTIRYLAKNRQVQKAKETIEIYAPIAHRLGVHAVKWELEDLSFAVLYPRKYRDIQAMVQQRRADRERIIQEATEALQEELAAVGVRADIIGRAKHFYSIFQKMQGKGKEFNEIYDLAGLRVIVDEVRDCYAAIGVIHSTWTPLPGRFKDYIAMPKMNGYQSLHTTVIGPQGKPFEVQVRTAEMHRTAEYGIAAHFRYKQGAKDTANGAENPWVRNLLEWEADTVDPKEFMESLRVDLYDDEVYVFTPKGEVKSLAAGATPLDFAYSVHTEVGHRCVGAKVNGRIVPLSHILHSGDWVEVLTSNDPERGPSRDWMDVAQTNRARSKIRQWFAREKREDFELRGRESLSEALKKQSIPPSKMQKSAVLASIIRELGFKKAEDFYVALGSNKFSPNVVVNKIIQELKTQQAIPDDAGISKVTGGERRRTTKSSEDYGLRVEGVQNSSTVAVRMAKCCKPVPGDPIVGYISLGRGITVHRSDCTNVAALRKNPERFTDVAWEGEGKAAFRVEVQVEAWDRTRLLEDVSRTISEHGGNIIQHQGIVTDDLVKERFTVEIGDVTTLKGMLSTLRNVDSVFDAYRVTPGIGPGA